MKIQFIDGGYKDKSLFTHDMEWITINSQEWKEARLLSEKINAGISFYVLTWKSRCTSCTEERRAKNLGKEKTGSSLGKDILGPGFPQGLDEDENFLQALNAWVGSIILREGAEERYIFRILILLSYGRKHEAPGRILQTCRCCIISQGGEKGIKSLEHFMLIL